MEHRNTLILLDTKAGAPSQNSKIDEIIKKQLADNPKRSVVIINTLGLPKVLVLSGETKEEVTINNETRHEEQVYRLIMKYVTENNTTVLACLDQKMRDWIKFKASFTDLNIEEIT